MDLDTVAAIREGQRRLRRLLSDQVARVLERWLLRAVRERAVAAACTLHAHLAFLFAHWEPGQWDAVAVTARCPLASPSRVFLSPLEVHGCKFWSHVR